MDERNLDDENRTHPFSPKCWWTSLMTCRQIWPSGQGGCEEDEVAGWPLVPVSGEELVKWLHYDDNKLHVRRLMDLLSIYQESVSGNITVLFYSCELLKFYVISTSLHFYFSISFSQHSFDVTEQRKYNSQFVLKFCSTSRYGGAASPLGLSSSKQKIQSS